MTHEQCLTEITLCKSMGRDISERCARAIAGYWHGGQNSALYSFASSGFLDPGDVANEVLYCIALTRCKPGYTDDDRTMLDALASFCVEGELVGASVGNSRDWSADDIIRRTG